MGELIKLGGILESGDAADAAAQFTAGQLEYNAGQVEAMGQRTAEESIRQNELVQSHMLAVAAASGGGTGGDVARMIAKVAGIGKLNALTDIYNSKSEAHTMRMQAAATRYEGKLKKRASRYAALDTVMSDAAKFAGGFSGSGTGFSGTAAGFEKQFGYKPTISPT